MRRDYDSGITETHERGWGGILLTIVGVSAVVFIGAWALLSVALRSIDTAAIVMIVTMFAVIILVGLPGIGMFAANVIQRNTITNVRAHDAMQQVIDATPRQLPQPAQFVTSGNTLQRQDKIAEAAIVAYRQLFPHTNPTRDAIKAVVGSSSNEFVSAVQSYYLERGFAEGGGQGKPVVWAER